MLGHRQSNILFHNTSCHSLIDNSLIIGEKRFIEQDIQRLKNELADLEQSAHDKKRVSDGLNSDIQNYNVCNEPSLLLLRAILTLP